PEGIRIESGDFRELGKTIPLDSIDLIFTDPNYGEDYLDLWQPLAELATRVLKPGGFFLTYSGQTFLPQVISKLTRHEETGKPLLEYYWMAGKYHDQGHVSIWVKKIWTQWKPILILRKPGDSYDHEWLLDMIRMGTRATAKELHDYGQSPEDAKYYIAKLTKPQDIVLDPCCGSGAILLGAKALDRRVIGFDIEKETAEIALARLTEVNDKIFANTGTLQPV
ncbi:unnamed protein product, partial [marine sediment metagenome]